MPQLFKTIHAYKKAERRRKISSLLKHFKRTKRRNDLTDPTHPSKITYREINDFIQEYSQSHNLQVQTENIRNSLDIIKNFCPTKEITIQY